MDYKQSPLISWPRFLANDELPYPLSYGGMDLLRNLEPNCAKAAQQSPAMKRLIYAAPYWLQSYPDFHNIYHLAASLYRPADSLDDLIQHPSKLERFGISLQSH